MNSFDVEIPISQIYGRGVPDRLIIVSGPSVSLATTEYEIHTDIYDIGCYVFHLRGRCFTRPDRNMSFFWQGLNSIPQPQIITRSDTH